MTSTLEYPTSVTSEDIDAAEQLALEATSTSDVATLREMLTDQNEGSTTITVEDGSIIEVPSIGQEPFAELGRKAMQAAHENSAVHAESWHTEAK